MLELTVSNLLFAFAKVLDIALQLYLYIIIARALVSWVNPDPYNPIVQFLYRATEPVLNPIRSMLPYMAIDLSPMIVIFVIYFLQSFLVRTLLDLAYRLRQ